MRYPSGCFGPKCRKELMWVICDDYYWFDKSVRGTRFSHGHESDLIFQSLLESFSSFIINFNMNKILCLLPDILNMLRSAQTQMKRKGKEWVLAIASTSRSSKMKSSSKKKKKLVGHRNEVSKEKSKVKVSKEKCFHCGL